MSRGAPTVSSDAVTRLVLQVFKLNGRLLAAGDRLVQDVGLTSARWQVLGAIALAHTPQPVAGIARTMGLSRQGVQRTVNELVASGLLEFRTNPHHQTAQLVVLTRKGAAAYEAAHARQRPWAEHLSDGLRSADLAIAQRVLSLLTERLEAAERSPIKTAHRHRGSPVVPHVRKRAHGQTG
jgi:DNA-binding MarR family transcriptional regulator